MLISIFFSLSISAPIYSISATTCTISGDGTVDQDSYRKSGSYSSYTIINVGKYITELGDKCFLSSESLTTINFETPSYLTTLGHHVFDTCRSLQSLKLPDSVTDIGSYILRACKVPTFEVGPNVKSIGIPISYGSKIFKTIHVHEDNQFYSNDEFGALYNKNKTILYTVPCGCDTNFSIPLTVIEIYSQCFHAQLTLKTIFIPKSVSKINERVFEYNDFSTILKFQEGIKLETIAENAFTNWISLITVEFPESLTLIPNFAFSNCLALENVFIPASVKNISTSAFTGCSSLKNVTISLENQNFASVESVVFTYDKTEMLIIPANIESVIIPENCTKIPLTALQYAYSLTSVTVDDRNEYFTTDGSIIYQNNVLLCCIGGVSEINVKNTTTQISNYAFSYNKKIQNVDLSKTLISIIGSYAFHYANLSSVTFPPTLKQINSRAFENSAISNVIFESTSDSLPLSLSGCCFYRCKNLTSLTFPHNIKTIDRMAFSQSNLETVIFADNSTLENISDESFSYCKINYLQFPDSLKIVDVYAFRNNEITSIKFGSGIQRISSNAFMECEQLGEVTFPEQCDLEEIQSAAFISCHSLIGFIIPSDTLNVHFSAFQDCTNLINITVFNENNDSNFHSIEGILYSKNYSTLIICPNGRTVANVDYRVEELGENSFYGCIKLIDLTFKKDSNGMSSLHKIGSNTFYNCISLANVEFPNTLQVILEDAFSGCSRLVTLDFGSESNLTSIGKNTFKGCTLLKNVKLPDISSLSVISKFLFEGCSSLEIIRIPNTVHQLSEGCFSNCISLSKVVLNPTESDLTSIGKDSFKGCIQLTSFQIPISLSTIEKGAFSSCSKLKNVIYCGYSDFSTSNNTFEGCHQMLRINVYNI